MIEKLNQTAILLPLENSRYTQTNLKKIITDVHPHLINTGLPEVAEKLFLSLKPIVCHEKESTFEQSNGLLRGSLLKRYFLGTPEGFLDIPNFYLYFKNSEEFKNSNILTQHVGEKLAEGPVEIDGRFVFKKEKEKQIPVLLRNSFKKQGYKQTNDSGLDFYNDRYKATILPIIIDKGTKFERVLYHVRFTEKDKLIFNIDILGMLDESIYTKELRLSASSSFFEMESTSEMIMKDGAVEVMADNSLIETHYGSKGAMIAHGTQNSSTDTFGHVLRLIGGLVFWPVPGINNKYSLKNINSQLITSRLTHNSTDIISNNSHNFLKEQNVLNERQETLVSDLLLYLTFDPFLFLYLGYQSHLLDHTPLGDYLKNDNNFVSVIKKMAKELIGDDTEGNLDLAYLSNYYKKTILQAKNYEIQKTGGYMLLRALGKDTKLDNIISLINPYQKYFIN